MRIYEENNSSNRLRYKILAIGLISGAVVAAYPMEVPLFVSWSRYASQLTIFYWALGLLFLFLKLPRLTLVSFFSCVFLCLFLKDKSSPVFFKNEKESNQPKLKIAHFNISAANSGYNATIRSIKNLNADVVSVQEATPDWFKTISDSLQHDYPYNCSIKGSNFLIVSLYSKYPFSYCDTFYCENSPNILIGFRSLNPKQEIYVVSSYVEPPLFELAKQQINRQFDSLARRVQLLKSPVITLGEYNLHPSSNEILTFRDKTGLVDSRRGYRPTRNDGHISLLDVPTDHIFYSSKFECVDFQTINGPSSERLGIMGTYQFNRDSLLVSYGR